VTAILEAGRHASSRTVNAIMTATYWDVGRRIVEFEQGGRERAGYGDVLIQRLSADLTARFGRGFSPRNLEQMRLFYRGWPIPQTPSAKSASGETGVLVEPASLRFPLPWSHYVRLLAVRNPTARRFYETEALLAGHSAMIPLPSRCRGAAS